MQFAELPLVSPGSCNASLGGFERSGTTQSDSVKCTEPMVAGRHALRRGTERRGHLRVVGVKVTYPKTSCLAYGTLPCAEHHPIAGETGMKRRKFLATGSVLGASSILARGATSQGLAATTRVTQGVPTVIATWDFGVKANAKAMAVLKSGSSAVEAVQQGVMIVESDPKITSVGYGGLPNASGVVELDASIMDGNDLECGAVAALSGFENPVSVARKVMEETPHVLIVGSGAREFALSKGFQERDLLTDAAREAWHKWREGERKKDQTEDHDTIGMVALDSRGQMAAACTTSGLAWKIPGRVGDSPLVGHGLYCDSKVGGAAATGIGEEVIKVCGSYQVVEFMRQGVHPQMAVRKVLQRVLDRQPTKPERWVGFIALRKDGEVGFASTNTGFQVAVANRDGNRAIVAESLR